MLCYDWMEQEMEYLIQTIRREISTMANFDGKNHLNADLTIMA